MNDVSTPSDSLKANNPSFNNEGKAPDLGTYNHNPDSRAITEAQAQTAANKQIIDDYNNRNTQAGIEALNNRLEAIKNDPSRAAEKAEIERILNQI